MNHGTGRTARTLYSEAPTRSRAISIHRASGVRAGVHGWQLASPVQVWWWVLVMCRVCGGLAGSVWSSDARAPDTHSQREFFTELGLHQLYPRTHPVPSSPSRRLCSRRHRTQQVARLPSRCRHRLARSSPPQRKP
ncbi:hypothetical protein BU16DRAFT_365927 [Lophium mytilinum]|uniref:Uncharacterized protein n=1 Tax=Lophium mytilinum TaxID=390894 RepID=A0A6A6QV86_9PEZI|nr:hypothetical protein BU16DRAFT_365927 [Lophium mytilinum]